MPVEIPPRQSSLMNPKDWSNIPRRFRSGLAARPAAQNFAWLLADRGVRLAVGIIVTSWAARYFGLANFGLLNYAMALVAIFAAIIPLGMDALVVRDIIRDESAAGDLIGTVMGFRGVTACVCAILSIVAAILLRPGEKLLVWIVSIIAVGYIAQTLESGELLFQARIQMRRLVVPRLALFLVMNGLKIALIMAGLRLFWFAILTGLEMVVSGLLTYVFVRRALGPVNRLCFEFQRGWELFRDAWPLAVAGLAVILYMKIGMIIVGSLLGNAALGIYAAAIRVPESMTFISIVLASSLLPGLIKNRELGAKHYDAALLRYFRINVLIAYGVCLPLSFGAPWIIRVLFHNAYAAAAPVMMIYVWSLVFVFLGVARGQHLLNERLTGMALLFSLAGLGVNLVCNFLFIPIFGVMGAAIATVASYSVSALFSSFFVPSTRQLARLQCLALISPWLILRRNAAQRVQPQ
jgi:PST family polysaccharide transporter